MGRRGGGGGSVCVYVLWRSLVGGLEGGTCCVFVCFMLGLLHVWCVHVVVAWSMIVVTVWCMNVVGVWCVNVVGVCLNVVGV